LFEDMADAEEFRSEYQPDGRILTVTLPDAPSSWGIMMTQTVEGYVAVYRQIDAQWIG